MSNLPCCLAVLGALGLAAFGPKRMATPPPSVVVLLPEPGGRSGIVTVTNQAGSSELTVANTAITIAHANSAPSGPAPMNPAAIRELFGAALDALPAEELVFNLHFRLGAAKLSPEAEAALPGLLQAVRERRSTLLTVTGHTDTTGISREANYRLGLDRANAVAERLRAIGLPSESQLIRSHGQDDLLVPTPPNTGEARNRRVEVILR